MGLKDLIAQHRNGPFFSIILSLSSVSSYNSSTFQLQLMTNDGLPQTAGKKADLSQPQLDLLSCQKVVLIGIPVCRRTFFARAIALTN